MSVKLICVCLLLVLLCPSRAKKQSCPSSASNCEECIQAGPECAWCTGSYSNVRCHKVKGLQRAGCHERDIYDPQGELWIHRNEPINAKAVFIQPQELNLHLRPGVNQTFALTISTPADQPTTELTMDTSPLPAGVNITFSGIMNGNVLVVQVNVEAAQCPTDSDDSDQKQNRTGPWLVHITPRGFSQSVKLKISLECQCDCTKNREENSPGCSGHGDLVCGQCECNKPYSGRQCQMVMDSFLSRNEDYCRSGPNESVCSGRGVCVEGFCECETRKNPNEQYSGQFCECSNFDCPYHNASICGGHGRCECGQCVCDEDWTGEACSCTLETASCMATNGNLCNSYGICQCGACKCEAPYRGLTCEECPSCPGLCQQYAECVECRAFGTGAKKDRCDQLCGHLTVTMVESRDHLSQLGGSNQSCKMMSRDDFCFFYYTLSRTTSVEKLTVVRAKSCPHSK